MNKLLKREFIPLKEETQKYVNKQNETKIAVSTRKRWYATMECQQCKNVFTIKEKPSKAHLHKPCECCSRKNLAYKNFIEKATKKHKDKFDYSLITKDNYVNLYTEVKIICKKHGEFLQKPKDHTSKENGKLCCPACIKEFAKIKNKRSIESWKEELSLKAPHITMVNHGNSDSNLEKCTLECKHHGTFISKLADIKSQKYICPLCAQDHNSWGGRFRRTDVPGILYFIHIPELNLWKLGVTSKSTQLRLGQLEYEYSILWEHKFPTLKEAYEKESYLFSKYKENRRPTTLPKLLGKCKGNSELMTCSIPITAIHESNLMSKEP